MSAKGLSFLAILICLTTPTRSIALELPPELTIPPDVSVQCFGETDPSSTGTATAIAFEECANSPVEISFSDTIEAGRCINDRTIFRTWTATDACGNVSQATQIITVQDTTPPNPGPVPGDFFAQCASDVPPPEQLTTEDNCSGSLNALLTTVVIPGSCVNDFNLTRTWTFVDECGNATSQSQSITVQDTTPPIPEPAPADASLQCASDVPPPVQLTAEDNCSGSLNESPVADITPGNCGNDFGLTRTWTFADACGNTASASQSITVQDTTPPSPPSAPGDLELQCASEVPPPVELVSNDNCSGDIPVSPTAHVTPGQCPDDFTMVRTWTAVDECGNSSSTAQTIEVNDTTPPTIECPLDGSYADAIASDNCTSPVDPTFTDNPDGIRTWEAVDNCSNVASCSVFLCNPETQTAGYWNRQCLGVPVEEGGLSPARNGKGKGPKEPTEPDFELLMACADLELANLGFTNEMTCSGIEASPPNDACERALRQLTAMLLNLCSDRVQPGCPTCLENCGINGAADSVSALIDEIVADISNGACKSAAEKAALVNEGEGICAFGD